MDFIEFLKDKKLNGEDVFFRNNQFICNGKVYFSVKNIKKQLKVVDSEGQDTKYKVTMLKNSSEWHIVQKREKGQRAIFRTEKLSGYRFKINNNRVESYFMELKKDERKWISTKDFLGMWSALFLFVPMCCLLLILFVLIAL